MNKDNSTSMGSVPTPTISWLMVSALMLVFLLALISFNQPGEHYPRLVPVVVRIAWFLLMRCRNSRFKLLPLHLSLAALPEPKYKFSPAPGQMIFTARSSRSEEHTS